MTKLVPEFVELAPATLSAGIIYISMKYASAIHQCCCGCGEKVVTPLRPNRWRVTFDGEAVWLHPSIGNDFACKSHYWIVGSTIEWTDDLSATDVKGLRSREYDESQRANEGTAPVPSIPAVTRHKEGAFARVWGWLLRFVRR